MRVVVNFAAIGTGTVRSYGCSFDLLAGAPVYSSPSDGPTAIIGHVVSVNGMQAELELDEGSLPARRLREGVRSAYSIKARP